MIDMSVPIRSSEWSGTGTVIVLFSVFRCITTWLPLRRTSENPWRDKMAQTCRPEKTRSLPNFYLESRDKNFSVSSALDLTLVSGLQKQFNGFLKILAGRLNGVTLAGNVELGAQSDVTIPFTLDDGRQLLHALHISPIPF
jgi:hypothetical protein